jgi:hypothetical protein
VEAFRPGEALPLGQAAQPRASRSEVRPAGQASQSALTPGAARMNLSAKVTGLAQKLQVGPRF